jgi:hypothetical protein
MTLKKRVQTAWKKFRTKKRGSRDLWLTLAGAVGFFILGTILSVRFFYSTSLAPFNWGLKDRLPQQAWPLAIDVWLLHAGHTIFGMKSIHGIRISALQNWLIRTGTEWKEAFIFYGSILFGIACGSLGGWVLGMGKGATEHVEGRQLFSTEDEAFKGTEDEIKVSGKGINIHPEVPISRDRETRHIMIMGSIGAGKTQVIRNIFLSIYSRFKKSAADRIIIYDNKSDFTEGLPIPDKYLDEKGNITFEKFLDKEKTIPAQTAPPDQQDYILLAPWDERTYAWDVGKDVLNEVDAVEICKRIIPSSDDPFWSNAAREVLVAVFIRLQNEKGTNWSWKDIYAEIGDADRLAYAVLTFNPTMGSLFKDPGNKTAQSVLTTLATFALTIRLLTQAWDNINPLTGETYEEGRYIPKLSLREWALMPEVKQRVIILQGNKRYATLEKAFIQSIISAFGSIMNSPEMTDDKNRRIWFLLDEFPQLGKLEDFAPYLEVGRSKGLCVVLGLQDMAQLREIYKKETADVWAAICGTFIVCRSQGVETIEWIKKFLGEKTIRRWNRSFGKGGGSRSEQVQKEGVVGDHDILGLGPKQNGVEAIVSLNNEHGSYKLIWPYVSFTPQRRPQVQAGWTRFVASAQVSTEASKLQAAFTKLFNEGYDEPDPEESIPVDLADGDYDLEEMEQLNEGHTSTPLHGIPLEKETVSRDIGLGGYASPKRGTPIPKLEDTEDIEDD